MRPSSARARGVHELPKHAQRRSNLEHRTAEVERFRGVVVAAEPLDVAPEPRELALRQRVAASVRVAARELEFLAERSVLLAQPLDDQLGVGLLVHEQRVAHRGDAQREAAGGDALEHVLELRAHGRHHRRGAVPAERVLQEHGHHAVSVRHVRVPVAQRHHHLLQRVQGQVDVLRLAQRAELFDAGFADALRPGEVHQVELPAAHGQRARLTPLNNHREHAVRPAGLQVHRRLRDGAVHVAQEKQIQRLLFRAGAVRRASARVDHPVVVFQQSHFR